MFRKMLLAVLLRSVCFGALADMQSDRKAFIQKLINKEVFQKVEVPGNLPHLWVKPAFYVLDFDTKSKFVNVVYAYYITQDPKYNIVVLYDSQTGKEVAEFSIEQKGDFETIRAASWAAKDFVHKATEIQREECSINELWVSTKCGESDTTTGLGSCPTVGNMYDKLLPEGITGFFGETSEIMVLT